MAIFMPCRQRVERARDRRSTFSSDILARHCQATKNSRRLSLLAGLRPLHQFGTYQPAPMSHFPENYSHTLEVGGLPKLNAATLSPIYQSHQPTYPLRRRVRHSPRIQPRRVAPEVAPLPGRCLERRPSRVLLGFATQSYFPGCIFGPPAHSGRDCNIASDPQRRRNFIKSGNGLTVASRFSVAQWYGLQQQFKRFPESYCSSRFPFVVAKAHYHEIM